jgi:secretion/DNA translocation related TadE-like protein
VRLGQRSLVEKIAGDLGSGTFLAFATLLLVVGASTPLMFSANQAFEAERLDTAAELAALSAADSLSGYRTGHPCDVAAKVAQLNMVKLVECRIVGFDVTIRVSVKSIGMVHFASATATTS